MVQSGSYNDLLSSSSSIACLLDDIHQYEQQHSIELNKQLSIISSTCSNVDEEILSKTVETKEKGYVKGHVYISYLKAGAGIVMGLFVVVVLSSMREGLAMFSNWWLAKWSDDESYRYQELNNCTSVEMKNNQTVWLMSTSEWNNHRNHRFYVFCGVYTNQWKISLFIVPLIFLGSVLILVLVTLFRAISTEFMALNAGRRLHNK